MISSILLNVGVNYQRERQPDSEVLLARSDVFVDVNPLDINGQGVPPSGFSPSEVTYRAFVNGLVVGEMKGDAVGPAGFGPFALTDSFQGRSPQNVADELGLYCKLKYSGVAGSRVVELEVEIHGIKAAKVWRHGD